MKLFLTFFISFICSNALAQLVELTCVSPKDNFTLNFQLNEKGSSVYYSGEKQEAIFSNSSIFFITQMKDGTRYSHTISRTNGVMNVQNTDTKEFITIFNCSVERKRF